MIERNRVSNFTLNRKQGTNSKNVNEFNVYLNADNRSDSSKMSQSKSFDRKSVDKTARMSSSSIRSR